MPAKQKLKETILNLLEKYSADDISVKMICAESGYSKQTLYNNYYNWMDALGDAFEGEFLSHVGESDNYHDWVEGFRRVLVFMRTRKKAFYHVYNSSRRDEFIDMFKEHGGALVGKGIRDCSRDMGIPCSDKDYEFMLSFYMYVFIGIIRKYIENGMEEDPAYIASRCNAMMRYHIRNTLRNLADIDAGVF